MIDDVSMSMEVLTGKVLYCDASIHARMII
jgi:hypothetical protein